MELRAAAAIPDGPQWQYEPKWDGFRALDGELVVPLAGALSFDALQQRIHPAASRIALLARTTPALYLAFEFIGSRRAGRAARARARRHRFHGCCAGRRTLSLEPRSAQRPLVHRPIK
jgi:ATP-dependent DNA ligase